MTRRVSFSRQLERAWQASNSTLCIGLDPRVDLLPASFSKSRDQVLGFCQSVVDRTAIYASAFKPNHAFFASQGLENELAELIHHIHEHPSEVPVILDAKRGDIGSTAEHYAIEAFERFGADAVTVNPFLGWDTVEPFLEYQDRGVFVLCRTSNEGSGWLQNQPATNQLYRQIAERVHSLHNPNIGLVVGATKLAELHEIRECAPMTTLLVPGVGAQGARAEDVIATGCNKDGAGVLINVSRGILHHDQSEDYLEGVEERARYYNKQTSIAGSQ
ncbi:MAG: orotidine-5'-phosphate decarboxylase [Gammaproteobacteria bacterium]|nr:orotidine-5'-phosphate decarboxylase [Gammaproteobacteria bacterium]